MAAKPLLRWVGGKRSLLPTIIKALPRCPLLGNYIEPFLGGGAVFFKLEHGSAHLSDLNHSLISFYTTLRDTPQDLFNCLQLHVDKHDATMYYKVREQYNEGGSDIEQAARFFYLNLTCFNGVFRVNLRGEFNVPIGSKTRLDRPTQMSVLNASTLLKDVVLECCDFDRTLMKVKRHDFVFLDPPYPAISNTGYFQHYTLERFPTNSQERLAKAVDDVDQAGAMFLMTNADTPLVRQLYSRYLITEHEVPRYVSCKNVKPRATELLISNYERKS